MKPKYAFYNENDEYCAEYLRNLIKAKLIPDGVVDSRSITEVQPDDVKGFAQQHYFAGIAGWAVACRLAGWPDDRPIITGSCPCQPYSVAGKQAGNADERHLWPDLYRLIRAQDCALVIGEQVDAAIGKHWLDGVCVDLESSDYTVESFVLPACSVNAPHKRNRIYWVAGKSIVDHADNPRLERLGGHEHETSGRPLTGRPVAAPGDGGALADSSRELIDRSRDVRQAGRNEYPDGRSNRDVAHASSNGCEQGESSAATTRHGNIPATTDRVNPWHDAGWIVSKHDGKARRIPEPLSGIRLVASRIPARTPKLRAAGNSIVPSLAAEILGAWLDEHPNY